MKNMKNISVINLYSNHHNFLIVIHFLLLFDFSTIFIPINKLSYYQLAHHFSLIETSFFVISSDQ